MNEYNDLFIYLFTMCESKRTYKRQMMWKKCEINAIVNGYKFYINIVMVTLGTPDQGTCRKVSQIIGLLQAPDRTFMYLV